MRIDAWSDVVCPWCAIGKAHLEQALVDFEHADQVEVAWRAFELDPGAPVAREGAYEDLLAAKYGASAEGGRAMVGRLSAAAERAGADARARASDAPQRCRSAARAGPRRRRRGTAATDRPAAASAKPSRSAPANHVSSR